MTNTNQCFVGGNRIGQKLVHILFGSEDGHFYCQRYRYFQIFLLHILELPILHPADDEAKTEELIIGLGEAKSVPANPPTEDD